jgi:hypothetical protein
MEFKTSSSELKTSKRCQITSSRDGLVFSSLISQFRVVLRRLIWLEAPDCKKSNGALAL